MNNQPNVNIDTAKIEATMNAALLEGMNASFLQLSRLVRTKLSQAGTGRIYRIGKGRKSGRNLRAQGFHRASAPGFPPAVNTGRLRASFIADQLGRWKYGYARISKKDKTVILNYGSTVVYAPVLEFGNRRGTLRPRPYLRPSLDSFRKFASRTFEIAVRRHFGST